MSLSARRLLMLTSLLNEGRSLPIGHVSKRKDGDYKKQASGVWQRVSGVSDHSSATANTADVGTVIPSGELSPSEKLHQQVKAAEADLEFMGDDYVKIPTTDSVLGKSPVDHSKTKRLGGGQGIAELLTLDTPDGPVQVVWKSVAGEKKALRSNIEPGTFYAREAAAYQVARVMGVDDLVPETAAREVDGEMGSAQRFVKSKELSGTEVWMTPPDEYTTQVQLDKRDSERMRVFDFVTGNTDRHYGNILHADGAEKNTRRPVLIDNGLSFPEGPPDQFIQPVEQFTKHVGPLSKETEDWIKSIDAASLVPILRSHEIGEEGIRQTLYRLTHLQSDPQLLALGKNTQRSPKGRARSMQRWTDAAREAQDKLSLKQLNKVEELLGNR